MEMQEYDDLLRHLVRIAAHQDTINDDLREFARQHLVMQQAQADRNTRLDMFIERQDAINTGVQATLARVDVTLARVERILARLPRPTANGTDA
jgi:hypothetical protein